MHLNLAQQSYVLTYSQPLFVEASLGSPCWDAA